MTHESQIEKSLIDNLTHKGNQWTYRPEIKTEAALWANLRNHINRINLAPLDGVLLTDKEFSQIKNEFKRQTYTPFAAAQWLRGENGIAQIQIERQDISKGNVTLTLFSNKEIAGGISSYEVVNQVVPETDGPSLRGDVTLLINGLPVIHIELKSDYAKDGYYQAFDQLERYATAKFFDGIFATVQIFVISNKVATKYFTRPRSNSDFRAAKEFLFNWRDENNNPVEDLYDFTKIALTIPMAHELVSRYTILVDDKKGQKYTMVLRPYQIHAIKKIISSAQAHKGGYIWHATGSGKTITSFVATKLLAQTSISVARTVMIVDRKDLDSQTKNEFGKFASEYNTGLTSGSGVDNTLIVGIDNKRELVENFLSKRNNNTIIITTIQKLSRAIREARKEESRQFEKLKGEHIVFIVDECHRAVSDKEMQGIKKFFPMSTWIGLTGTPIFKENMKSESGQYARTTELQYGPLLHAYTTKNAMEDKSVLNFQVEYNSPISDEETARWYIHKLKEKFPTQDPEAKLKALTEDIDEEALLDSADFENDDYITAMLQNIFKHQSVINKFHVVNGLPTMSAILTTHRIAQAKRIYRILMELKASGNLITGRPQSEGAMLRDPAFPRVAITYSLSENQAQQIEAEREMEEIMAEYCATYGIPNYKDINAYNININERLARKYPQYKKDGQWLDFVIVVDRLLTGFDAPTIQTLYVDKELRWHGLLQAFSRTNRVYPGKKIGMIVTFRKPKTMARNVRDAIKLFSQTRDWEEIVPKEYKEIRQSLEAAYKDFKSAKREWECDPKDIKKILEAIKTFQTMKRLNEAIKSYEDYEEDFEELVHIAETLAAEHGHIENLKAEARRELEIDSEFETTPLDIEFSPDQRAVLEEKIDSYYISQLLRDINSQQSRQKLDEIIKTKPKIVRDAYEEAIKGIIDQRKAVEVVNLHFNHSIGEIIMEAASLMSVPEEDLRISFNEYSPDKGEVPYINVIIDKSTLTKESFEQVFEKKYRDRRLTLEGHWKGVIQTKLLPLREELVNFAAEVVKVFG